MPQSLILLSTLREGPIVADFLGRLAPGKPVRLATTRSELDAAVAATGGRARLVTFCSTVIVPRTVLEVVDGPSYNVHPGPPTYPGTFPDVWALYEGAARFGATLHVMAERVDEGPVVDVEWFDIPSGADRPWLALEALKAAVQLMLRWGEALALDPAPLPPHPELRWSGRKWRMADFDALCQVPPDVSEAELRRRERAVLGGARGELRLTLHGRTFRAEAEDSASDLWPWS
ncbi:MAG TPA: formyltransferase family protein [Azospirillaceae bacterium]|nr:formyltransferase family protein [Azospirillaceae bacterium]